MGLVAWWPLNGTLEDISGNDNHMIIDKNITEHAEGKIGSCYYANAEEGYMTSKYEVNLGKTHTYTAWVYPQGIGNHPGDNSSYTGLVGNFWHGSINYNTTSRLVKQSNGDFKLCVCYSQHESRPTTSVTTRTIPANKWSHVAYVVDDKTIRYYINGEHVQTMTIPKSITCKPIKITLFRWATSYSQYVLEGRLNDVRVYDEALSAKQVREISQAKILHYDFNQSAQPVENLSNGFTFTTAEQGENYFIKKSSDQWYQGMMLNSVDVQEGETYTWSFDVKCGETFSYQFDPNASGGSHSGNDAAMETSKDYTSGTYTQLNEWVKVHLTITMKADATDGYIYHTFCPSKPNSNLKIYIRNCMVEHRSRGHEGGYVEGSQNNLVVLDKSGFGNYSEPLHGVEAPLWKSECAIGRGSYFFENATKTSTGNYQHFGTHEPLYIPKEGTMCFWIKHEGEENTNNKYAVGYLNFCSMNNRGIMGLIYYYDGSNYRTRHSSADFYDGKWHHYAITWSPERIKLYQDGVLKGDHESGAMHHVGGRRQFVVGNAWGTSYGGHSGYLDDVRVYATPLSAEDIASVCRAKGSLHKNRGFSVDTVQEQLTFDELAEGVNLIRNGNCDLKSADNFSGTYVANDGPLGTGCFEKRSGSTTITSSDYIKVDTKCSYQETMYIKSVTAGNSWYGGIMCFDKSKNHISHNQVYSNSGSRTTLARALSNGDTVVYLTSSAGWNVGTAGTEHHSKQIGIFDRLEAPNYERASYCSRYLTVDTTAHTITLKYPWSGGTKAEGTKVANTYDGGSYQYLLGNGPIPMEWTKKTTTVSGSDFRFGTEYIKILILANRSGSDPTFRYANISFVNLTALQQPDWTNKPISVTENSILDCGKIHEVNYKPTLVDYSDWLPMTEGSVGGWSCNGSSYENTRKIKVNPMGDLDIVWATESNSASSESDGGWNNYPYTIDSTKKYRFTCWVRRENVGNGRTYFGCQGSSVCSLSSTSPNTNPYFSHLLISEAPELQDNWVLFVGYIHPSNYSSTSSDPTNGYYKMDGTRTRGVNDFKWVEGRTTGGIRSYLYYSTDQTERHYWYRPRFEVCDGSEPTISYLLTCSEHTPMLTSNLKNVNELNASFCKSGEVQVREIVEC